MSDALRGSWHPLIAALATANSLEPRSLHVYIRSMRCEVRAWVVVVALVGIVGCAGWRANHAYKADVDYVLARYSGRRPTIPAPTSDEPKPWKVGQWALYKRRAGDEIGYQMYSVVAEDACGIWIEEVLETYSYQARWLVCFRSSTTMPADFDEAVGRVQVVVAQSNDQQPEVFDYRDGSTRRPAGEIEGLVGRMFLPIGRRHEELPPEDVDVRAGHFAQANRSKQTATDGSLELLNWFHNDVPFDGTVKEVESHGYFDSELLGYNDYGARSVLPELAKDLGAAREPKRRSPLFFGFGTAIGWFSGHGPEASTGVGGLDVFYGYSVTPKLDLGLRALFVDVDHYSPDPTLRQRLFLAMLSVRWAPFGPTRTRYPHLPGASALYVQGGAGYGELDLATSDSSTTTARGFAAGLSLGWLGIQAQDWVVGLAVSDDISVFGSGEGTRNSFAFTAFVDLHIPWFGR